jgi:hypothetical protein
MAARNQTLPLTDTAALAAAVAADDDTGHDKRAGA